MAENDLIVIGSGPGGYVAAIRAAQLGARVTVIEEDKVGGTCLNYGCIPTKALYQSAATALLAARMEDFGVVAGKPAIDMAKVHSWKRRAVDKLTGGVSQLLKGYKINVVNGRARLAGNGKVIVKRNDGESLELESKNVLIATGSKQAVP